MGARTVKTLTVGMGEGVALAGDEVCLAVHGLGSCVALCLYDPLSRCGGLCHVVLPRAQRPGDPPAKFGDTAVGWLLAEMRALGASAGRVRAKIAGGANMSILDGERLPGIGDRNVEAVREALAREGIPLVAEDVGGVNGRTVFFFLKDGSLEVHLAGVRVHVL